MRFEQNRSAPPSAMSCCTQTNVFRGGPSGDSAQRQCLGARTFALSASGHQVCISGRIPRAPAI